MDLAVLMVLAFIGIGTLIGYASTRFSTRKQLKQHALQRAALEESSAQLQERLRVLQETCAQAAKRRESEMNRLVDDLSVQAQKNLELSEASKAVIAASERATNARASAERALDIAQKEHAAKTAALNETLNLVNESEAKVKGYHEKLQQLRKRNKVLIIALADSNALLVAANKALKLLK